MSKVSDVKNKYVACFLCNGVLSPSDAITVTVKGLLENGKKFQSLVTVCWFCTLDVNKPLALCLSSRSNLNANHKQAAIGAPARGEAKRP